MEQNYNQAEAARRLGLDPKMISRWIQEHNKEENQSLRGKGTLSAEQLKIKQLREAEKQRSREAEKQRSA